LFFVDAGIFDINLVLWEKRRKKTSNPIHFSRILYTTITFDGKWAVEETVRNLYHERKEGFLGRKQAENDSKSVSA